MNTLSISKSFYDTEEMKRQVIAIISCILLVILDQGTKYLFYDLMIRNNLDIIYPLLNNWISRWISMPMVVIFAISFVCIWIFCYLFHKKYFSTVDFVLLLAGTIGNLVDRIYIGWVRDFISVWTFPVFNVADAFLTCWVAWICIKEIFHLQKKEKKILSS